MDDSTCGTFVSNDSTLHFDQPRRVVLRYLSVSGKKDGSRSYLGRSLVRSDTTRGLDFLAYHQFEGKAATLVEIF